MVRIRRTDNSTIMTDLTTTRKALLPIAAIFAILLVVISMNKEESAIGFELLTTTGSQTKDRFTLLKDSSLEDKVTLSAFEGCTVTEILPLDQVPANIPFWVPSYPGSDNSVVAALVTSLTGTMTAAKSYYASSPGLKKCFSSSSLTVTCEQIHPIVSIGPPPERQSHKFQKQILLPIRNPMSAIPEHFQGKAVRYHGVQGQVQIDDWRHFRDQWLEPNAIDGWKSIITTWKNMTEYDGVGLYLPYEHLMDVKKGPELVSKLAAVIRGAGFPVAPESDVACVWYRAVRHHLLAKTKFYEYADDYIPRYTSPQMDYMAGELTQLQNLYPNDAALVAILKEYVTEIELTAATDQPWENRTTNVRY